MKTNNSQILKSIVISTLGWIVLTVAAQAASITDDSIQAAVDRAFRKDTIVPSHSVNVAVDDGVAGLSGLVDNILIKERATRIASSVRGVQGVVSMILVDPPRNRTNLEMRQDIMTAVVNNPATEGLDVRVTVDDGYVTLFGEVGSWIERQLVEKVVKSVRGVRSLESNITLEYSQIPTDDEIETKVRESLKWNFMVDHLGLDVSVSDKVVTLEGAVRSLSELDKASELAWVRGVNSVVTDLVVIDPERKSGRLTDGFSDSEIAMGVKSALIINPITKPYNIKVEVDNNVASLSGAVSSLNEKFEAENTALETSGVTAVDNRLIVIFNEDLTEVEIETDIRSAFVRDSYLSGYTVDVSVENGIAVLEGEVDSSFEKSWAAYVASGVPGVIDVDNKIEVDPIDYRPLVYGQYIYTWPAYQFNNFTINTSGELSTDEAIKVAIESELFWSPFVDSDDIKVSVKDRIATLKGTVDTVFEMNTAIANGLEGDARYVRNRLKLVE